MAERLVFDRSLYLPEAVEAAAAAYADHARVAVTAAGDHTDVEISETGDYEPAALAHAFANHVLFETITRKRQAALDES